MWVTIWKSGNTNRAVVSILKGSRWLSGTSIKLNKNNSSKPVENMDKSEILQQNLFLTPQKWKGLPPQDIILLHEERKVKLGPNYQPNKDELDALYTTSKFMDKTEIEIKKLYDSHWESINKIHDEKKQNNNRARMRKYSPNDLKYGLRPFQFDDLPSAVQDDISNIRDERFYKRIAAYELPQLVKYRTEYTPINVTTHPIKYRYTTYLGEEHPNSKKVVLSCHTKDLPLNAKQLHKFRLLARTRYNYETDEFKMSSEKFLEPMQNAGYLNDILQRLLKESKDLSEDSFEDIPLDTRHIKAQNSRKKKGTKSFKFPEEWKRPQDAPTEKVNILKEVF